MLMYVFAFFAALLGSVLLCGAMQKHHRQLWPNSRLTGAKKWSMTISGYLMLALSIALCAAVTNFGVGLAAFFGIVSATIFGLAVYLSFATK
ncbi:MAG: DUF3325 domain-containing protein [Pseudomonadota bacterium]